MCFCQRKLHSKTVRHVNFTAEKKSFFLSDLLQFFCSCEKLTEPLFVADN